MLSFISCFDDVPFPRCCFLLIGVMLLLVAEMDFRSWRRLRIRIDRAGSWKTSRKNCENVNGNFHLSHWCKLCAREPKIVHFVGCKVLNIGRGHVAILSCLLISRQMQPMRSQLQSRTVEKPWCCIPNGCGLFVKTLTLVIIFRSVLKICNQKLVYRVPFWSVFKSLVMRFSWTSFGIGSVPWIWGFSVTANSSVCVVGSDFAGLLRSLIKKSKHWRVALIEKPTKCWMRKSSQWWDVYSFFLRWCLNCCCFIF